MVGNFSGVAPAHVEVLTMPRSNGRGKPLKVRVVGVINSKRYSENVHFQNIRLSHKFKNMLRANLGSIRAGSRFELDRLEPKKSENRVRVGVFLT